MFRDQVPAVRVRLPNSTIWTASPSTLTAVENCQVYRSPGRASSVARTSEGLCSTPIERGRDSSSSMIWVAEDEQATEMESRGVNSEAVHAPLGLA